MYNGTFHNKQFITFFQAIGTTVPVTLNVVDPDAGETHVYSIPQGAYSDWFAINPNTGKVSIAKVLDAEDPLLPAQISISGCHLKRYT